MDIGTLPQNLSVPAANPTRKNRLAKEAKLHTPRGVPMLDNTVRFLESTVRHVHPGGQYVKGDKDYEALKRKIEEVLAEK